MSATASADDMAFKSQLGMFLSNHFRAAEPLPDGSPQVGMVFSINRDGTLLTAEVDQSSGSRKDDASALERLRKLQPFPHVPDDLPVPYKIATTTFFVRPDHIGYLYPIAYAADSETEKTFKKRVFGYLSEKTWILPETIAMPPSVLSIITFTIDRNGKLTITNFTRGFGSRAAEESALEWLRKQQPFPRIPRELNAPMTLTAELKIGPKMPKLNAEQIEQLKKKLFNQ
jgi:TonB family protein